MIPYFWVRGTPVDNIEEAFTDHPGVKQIEFVDFVADKYLLRVEWAVNYDDVLTVLTDTEIALIEATGTNQQWTFEIRGTREATSRRFNLAVGSWISRLH